eukprot:gnl/TRDRNA2_/TRDRNA2_40510_c0_seq1.p1 gnl/TRDRNA2_/TRDRNA2_40510_c0~~gnl/TRDRNA2_/TRDRNA2_40510_c0_seq1.p1  ORF type:complete len:278 (-),score=65.98 gnl/TRDRNA2_/TRDRNA2_40510_c0_seq1:46-879(-)
MTSRPAATRLRTSAHADRIARLLVLCAWLLSASHAALDAVAIEAVEAERPQSEQQLESLLGPPPPLHIVQGAVALGVTIAGQTESDIQPATRRPVNPDLVDDDDSLDVADAAGPRPGNDVHTAASQTANAEDVPEEQQMLPPLPSAEEDLEAVLGPPPPPKDGPAGTIVGPVVVSSPGSSNPADEASAVDFHSRGDDIGVEDQSEEDMSGQQVTQSHGEMPAAAETEEELADLLGPPPPPVENLDGGSAESFVHAVRPRLVHLGVALSMLAGLKALV